MRPILFFLLALSITPGSTWSQQTNDRGADTQPAVAQSHYEQLKVFEWMVGHWVDDADDARIEIDCSWTNDRNFLKRSFRIQFGDEPETSGMHMTGWDPATNQIRTWNFYSNGGFSEVVWKHEKDRWFMHYKGVGSDGHRWTAVGIIKPVDKDTFTWQLTEQIVDGKPLPDNKEVKIVRK
jgi:hypothetical protein